MTVDVSKAARLMKVVELKSVRLVAADMAANPPPVEGAIVVTADFNYGGGRIPTPVGDKLLFNPLLEVVIRPDGSPDPIITIHATFELEYSIPPETAPTSEELAAFAGANAIFNAWPYWREFVQSTCVRMGHPPLLLPVFRLQNVGQRMKGVPSPEKTAERASAGGKTGS